MCETIFAGLRPQEQFRQFFSEHIKHHPYPAVCFQFSVGRKPNWKGPWLEVRQYTFQFRLRVAENVGKNGHTVLFDRSAVVQLDDFIAFDIAGGWFAIASREKYAPDAAPGSGAVPYIRVANLEVVRERATIALGEPAPAIIIESGISLLKLEDPNGQLVEFFMVSMP